MALDLAAANTYFGAKLHVEAATWSAFSTDKRSAAIAQAKRLLVIVKGEALDETVTTDDDLPREDCALYETALHMLKNTEGVMNGDIDGSKVLADDNTPDERSVIGGNIPQIAWLYMGRSGYPPSFYRG